MKFNIQTRLKTDTQRGNCFPTVISCILDLDSAEDVLQFQELYGNEEILWIDKLSDWLETRGYELQSLDGHQMNDTLYFVGGNTIRNILHVCIYKNGKLFHDPHPDGNGLITETSFQHLVKLDTL